MSSGTEQAQELVRAQGLCGALTQDLGVLTVCIRPAGHPHPSPVYDLEDVRQRIRDAIANRPVCPHYDRADFCADCDASAAMSVVALLLADPDQRWYLATCQDCTPPLPMPFRSPTERDAWTTIHATATGHAVTHADG